MVYKSENVCMYAKSSFLPTHTFRVKSTESLINMALVMLVECSSWLIHCLKPRHWSREIFLFDLYQLHVCFHSFSLFSGGCVCVYNDQLKDGLEEELFYHTEMITRVAERAGCLVLGPLSFTLSAHLQG